MRQEFSGLNSTMTSGKHLNHCGTLTSTGRRECPGTNLCSKVTVFYQQKFTSPVEQGNITCCHAKRLISIVKCSFLIVSNYFLACCFSYSTILLGYPRENKTKRKELFYWKLLLGLWQQTVRNTNLRLWRGLLQLTRLGNPSSLPDPDHCTFDINPLLASDALLENDNTNYFRSI